MVLVFAEDLSNDLLKTTLRHIAMAATTGAKGLLAPSMVQARLLPHARMMLLHRVAAVCLP